MKRRYLDLYLGLFILAGLAVAGYMIVRSGGMLPRKGYEVTVLFNDVGGLIKGAPVRYMGYECGKVRDIDVILWRGADKASKPSYKVKVVLFIDQMDRRLRKEDEVKIVDTGLLGEKLVKIVPGALEAQYLSEEDEVMGTDPEGLIAQVVDVFGPLAHKETQENIANILESFSASIPTLMSNLNQLTGEELQIRVRDTVEGLSLAVNDFRTVLADFRSGVRTITGAGEQAQRLLAENREQISGLLMSLDETLNSFDRVVDRLDPIVADIRAGKGGLGKLINDPSWYTNFSKILLGLRTHGFVNLQDALKDEEKQARRRPPEPTVRVW